MIFLLDVVTILSVGVLIGAEFAVSAFINPVVWQLQGQAQAFAVKSFAKTLGKIMPVWYGANLFLVISEAVLRRHQPGAPLLVGACLVWALTIVVSLVFLVPINNRLRDRENQPLSAAENQAHRRWDAGHRVRVAALLLAFILALIVLLG